MNKKGFYLFLILTITLVCLAFWQKDFFNQNSGLIQIVLSILLVAITGIYAYFNYQMVEVMSKQTIADIKISNKILKSIFLEKWFIGRLKNSPDQITENSCLEFTLFFDVFNKGVGCGSIEKPFLILKFKNTSFEYKIKPVTKESYDEKISDNGTMQTYKTVVNDFGGTLYLRGGEFQKIELEYSLWDIDKELLNNIKENIDSLEYLIEFKDNLDRKYLKKIEKICEKS